MYAQRKSVKSKVSISGVGLHSGIYTRVAIHPAPAGSGITFVRADLDGLRIPALQASTTALDYATTVGKDDVQVERHFKLICFSEEFASIRVIRGQHFKFLRFNDSAV